MSRHEPLAARGTPSRVVLGLVAALVAWVVVLAQLASTLHFALISHEICAAHGELLHSGSAPETRAAHHPEGSAALPAGSETDHDHCPLLGRRHDHLAVVLPAVLEIAPPAVAVTEAGSRGTTVTPTRARLLLSAPKQSPPV